MDVTVVPRAGTGNKLAERRVFVKEMSVLSAEGVKVNLIGHVYSGTRESAETSASSGMAPFVAILGLISICKRDNCSHMEAIDRRGQCNCFLQEGGGARQKTPSAVISVGIGRNKNPGGSGGEFLSEQWFLYSFTCQ